MKIFFLRFMYKNLNWTIYRHSLQFFFTSRSPVQVFHFCHASLKLFSARFPSRIFIFPPIRLYQSRPITVRSKQTAFNKLFKIKIRSLHSSFSFYLYAFINEKKCTDRQSQFYCHCIPRLYTLDETKCKSSQSNQ